MSETAMNELSQIEILQEKVFAAEVSFTIAQEAYNTAEKSYNLAKKAYYAAKDDDYRARVALARACREAYCEAQTAETVTIQAYRETKRKGTDVDKLLALREDCTKVHAKVSFYANLYDLYYSYAPLWER